MVDYLDLDFQWYMLQVRTSCRFAALSILSYNGHRAHITSRWRLNQTLQHLDINLESTIRADSPNLSHPTLRDRIRIVYRIFLPCVFVSSVFSSLPYVVPCASSQPEKDIRIRYRPAYDTNWILTLSTPPRIYAPSAAASALPCVPIPHPYLPLRPTSSMQLLPLGTADRASYYCMLMREGWLVVDVEGGFHRAVRRPSEGNPADEVLSE
jgi:hypothetical protein